MSKRLLVLTCQDDLHADAVIRQLRDDTSQFEIIRVNTDNLTTNLSFDFAWDVQGKNSACLLESLDAGISVESVDVIWYRKPDVPAPHPALNNDFAKQCSVAEYKEFMRAFYGVFSAARWVNDFWQMQKFSVKPNQIPLAREVGFKVPETLVTNRIKVLREFVEKHRDVIVKPMAFSGFSRDEKQYGCFTNVFTLDDVELLSEIDLAYAPAIFQRRIPKARELRITVMGADVFACEIKTLPGTPEHIDWRVQTVEDLPHTIVEVPNELKRGLREILQRMGLNFGAFDFIIDPEGDYYFIEVNPNGQYLWIELLTGVPLTASMVRLIKSLSKTTGSLDLGG